MTKEAGDRRGRVGGEGARWRDGGMADAQGLMEMQRGGYVRSGRD
jgi:hypothetical protein